MRVRAAVVLIAALGLPVTARTLESEMPELTSYMGIRFQGTTLPVLMERLGKSPLLDPPGEVLLPDEVCYRAAGELKATFFVEHYGRSRSASTVIGVAIERDANSDDAGHVAKTMCASPKVTLSGCVGKLCLGDSIERVAQIMRKEMTYPGSFEWIYYDVHLSQGDLVVSAYRDAIRGDAVPDWMEPSHTVRVQTSNGLVTAIYVAIGVDMA